MNTIKFKKGLGRGLSSLLGDTKSKTNITKLSINDVKRNRLQPRKVFNKESLEELTNSIKENGVIQPIIVRSDKSLEGKFEIIAGERRWLASQNAGLNEIPVIILDIDDEKSLEFAIVENVQRQDLNAIEEAQGYQRLINEFSYNQVTALPRLEWATWNGSSSNCLMPRPMRSFSISMVSTLTLTASPLS